MTALDCLKTPELAMGWDCASWLTGPVSIGMMFNIERVSSQGGARVTCTLALNGVSEKT